jgi:GNAT superfamily N-acetyltransferase
MPNEGIELRRSDRDDPLFIELTAELDADLWRRYPSTQEAYAAGNAIAAGASVVLCLDAGKAAGCGCFRELREGMVELKRMFVRPEYRGRGIASSILRELEAWAAEGGARRMILETGLGQPEAIGLYEKRGYSRIENFGAYAGNAESVCMAKPLEREGEERL